MTIDDGLTSFAGRAARRAEQPTGGETRSGSKHARHQFNPEEDSSVSVVSDPWEIAQQQDTRTTPPVDPSPVEIVTGEPDASESDSTGAKPPRSVNRSDWEMTIYNCPDVNRIPKMVGVVLSRSADFETGRNAYPSQARIAAILDYTKTQPVANALRELREEGWLYRDGKGPTPKGGGRPNDRYRLTVPKHAHPHDGTALPQIDS